MIKLMKYEFLRRKPLLLGALLSIIILEGITIFTIFQIPLFNGLTVMLTLLLVIGALLLPLLNTVTKLYSDLKHKQGYMLFLTPQSGNKIILAKTLYGAVETLVSAALVAGCLTLSAHFANQAYPYDAVTEILNSIQHELGMTSLDSVFAVYALLIMFQLIAQMSIAVLAVTFSRVILRATNYGWLVALLMYFVFSLGVNIVNGILLLAFGLAGDIISLIPADATQLGGIFSKYFLIGAFTYGAWFVGCTALSGRLASKNVDL